MVVCVISDSQSNFVMENDEALIEAVREYPCLYNSTIADFKITLKKENAWKAISTQLRRSGEYFYSQLILALQHVVICSY